jgi:hypothetical protein
LEWVGVTKFVRLNGEVNFCVNLFFLVPKYLGQVLDIENYSTKMGAASGSPGTVLVPFVNSEILNVVGKGMVARHHKSDL